MAILRRSIVRSSPPNSSGEGMSLAGSDFDHPTLYSHQSINILIDQVGAAGLSDSSLVQAPESSFNLGPRRVDQLAEAPVADYCCF